MHLLEFAENSADFQHFQPLHGKMGVPFTNMKLPFIDVSIIINSYQIRNALILYITHIADWKLDTDLQHLSYFHDTAFISIFGKKLDFTTANANIKSTAVLWFLW